MENFPVWADQWFAKDQSDIGSGLNLALRLENPSDMPWVIYDIAVAQPSIQRALDRLSFLHYARFVPSHDGVALMVITEFDGPLEPYIMDFVIAIGDVFNLLMGYVDPAIYPRKFLPIQDHTDEFLKFVLHWNRLPLGRRLDKTEAVLLPKNFHFPVYSAYPKSTVLELAPKRRYPPRPALDRPAAAVKFEDVQGNIFRPYKAETAVYLFLEIVDAKKARNWISGELLAPEKSWKGIRNAQDWLDEAPQVFCNLALTAQGLMELLPKRAEEIVQKFPTAFTEGAIIRAEENGDVGQHHPDNWRFGRRPASAHVVICLHFKKIFPNPEEVITTLVSRAEANGLKKQDQFESKTLNGSEIYFGYQDGISQPNVNGLKAVSKPDWQPASSPGEFLLGPNYENIYGGPSIGRVPQDIGNNGTFGVLRLMEQHVEAFEETVKNAATKLGVTEDEIKAKLLGRYPDGSPATLAQTANVVNTFDYAPSWEHPNAKDDSDGALCPIGAHIRRTNPRSARVAGTSHSRRLIRRGMPANWMEEGSEHKGLLGLFICADIERQFEFIQRQWIQGDLAAAGIRGSQDPIAGLREGTTPFAIGEKQIEVPPLTTTRGCLYLFYPSLSVLQQFTDINVTPAEAPDNQPQSFEFFGLSASKIKAALLKTAQNLPDNLANEMQGLVQSLIFNTAPNSPRITQIVDSALSTRKSVSKPDGVRVASFDPLSQEFLRDPYDAYEKELEKGNRIVWVPQHNACWVLSYELCTTLLHNSDQFRQSESYSKVKGIISLDRPRHTKVRIALEEAFTQLGAFSSATDEAKAERNDAIDLAVTSALTRIQDLEQFDFVRDYSDAISRDVFWGMYGIPDTEKEIFDALARRMMRHFSQPQREGWSDALVFADASAKLAGRIALRVARLWAFNNEGNTAKILAKALAKSFGLEKATKEEASANNLIANLTRQIPSTIKSLEDDKEGISFVECVATLLQLVLAGYMPIQFLLGTTAMNVINGNAWNNGLDIENALQEGRRFEPSVTIVQRFAKEGAQLGVITFPKDCAVHAVVASANRNGPAPNSLNSFDPTRAAFAHLSLGHGVHQCVGSWLQAQIAPKALKAILEDAPNLKLRHTDATPAWFDNIYFRGLESLPVQRG